MPFEPINFANIKPQGNPLFRDLLDNLMQGYQLGQVPAQLQRQKQKEELANAMQKLLVEEQPEKFTSEQEGRVLGNEMQRLLNQEQPQKFGSEMSTAAIARALQQANINRLNTMTPLEARELALKNAWYPKVTQAKIDYEAFGGGSGLGTGAREDVYLNQLTAQSNPQFDKKQSIDAANAVREGRSTLPDGTKINITPEMLNSLDRADKYRTNSELLSNMVRGKQADAEIKVLSKYVGDAIAPFGDTIAGRSPSQIMATFSNKKDDQIKLGRLAAAQQLQADLAANQNIINSGRPTASITREILRDSEMKIKTNWPFMSNVARQEALRYVNEALHAALDAKQSVGIGASNAFKSSETPSKKRLKYNASTGDFE